MSDLYVENGVTVRCTRILYSIEIVGHAMTQRAAQCGQLVLVRAPKV